MNLFFSNRVETLFDRLKETLFGAPFSPFTRRLVVVPSPAMKSWVMLRLARDPNVGIAAGMEISDLDDTLSKIGALASRESVLLPSELELSLAVETELYHILQEVRTDNLELWRPLIQYLKLPYSANGSPIVSRKMERRIAALSEKLAQLFLKYGKYGLAMLHEWERKSPLGWQQLLWRRLCESLGLRALTFSTLIPPKTIAAPHLVHVHLFAMSFLSRQQHHFLLETSKMLPVSYYLLSPCMAFWSDIKSDKESWHLRDYWQKRGTPDEQQQALDEFLRDRNPLLANFGKLGREMAAMIEESDAATDERYVLPRGVQEFPCYENGNNLAAIYDEEGQSLSMLDAVQADMALLRNPEDAPKIIFKKEDRTIQVHKAATPMREVQILYNNIMRLIDQHYADSDPICPGDVVVMAPDIMVYEPYIRSVFGNESSALAYQIADMKIPVRSTFIQGFLLLVSLPLGRWDAASLHELWEHPAFQHRHQLVGEEIQKIWNWTKDSGVVWGHDVAHREEMFKRDHCDRGANSDAVSGTWDFGMSRLLASLVMTVEGDPDEGVAFKVLPLEVLDSSKGELLGKWIALLKSLKSDLKPLSDGTAMTVEEWGFYLKCLCDGWLSTVPFDDEASEIRALYEVFESFQRARKIVGDALYTFTTIRKHMEAALNKSTSSYREQHLKAIRFCSLLPMRAIPSKVIMLLGMQEGAFPRIEPNVSLDMMKGNPSVDYCPSQTDFDRYLFLEALISARKYFVMSYQGFSVSDSKEQLPSLVVAELLGYLDKAYRLGEQLPSNVICISHPYHAFDQSYFDVSSEFRSYSLSQYQAAKAYYHHDKRAPHSFILDFTVDSPQSGETINDSVLSLRELAAFARNPIKVHFNKTLGIYIGNEEDKQLRKAENFVLPNIDAKIVASNVLKKPLNQVWSLSEKHGKLPTGIFKQMEFSAMHDRVEKMKDFLHDLQIDLNASFEIELSESCTEPSQDDKGNWMIPPLSISLSEEKVVHIVGKLSMVTNQGLVVHDECKNSDLAKHLPQYLIFECLVNKHQLKIEKQLVFAEDGKTYRSPQGNPEKALQEYLHYYYLSLRHPSPLIPEWIECLTNDDVEKFEATMKESLKKDTYSHFYNEYFKWITRGAPLPDSTTLWKAWKPIAERVFSKVLLR